MRIQHTQACQRDLMGKAVAVFRESIADGYNYDVQINGRPESARDLTPLRLLALLDAAVEQEQDRGTCGCAKLALQHCETELSRLRAAQRHSFNADRLGPIADYTAVRDELRAYLAGTR